MSIEKSATTGEGLPPLESLLRWFHAVVSHPSGVTAGAESPTARTIAGGGSEMIERLIIHTDTLDASTRLGVYAHAYYARLIECLGEVFPMLKKFLGDEVFDGFAFEYLQEFPSRSYTLHHLGRHFPEYLEKSRPVAEREAGVAPVEAGPDWPELLIDLARLEWAIYEVFDGPGMESRHAVAADAPPADSKAAAGAPSAKTISTIRAPSSPPDSRMSADALLDVPIEAWDSARIRVAPCVRVLAARFPVNPFFTALRQAKEGESVTPPDAGASWIALNRRRFIVRRHDLTQPAYELLGALIGGHSLGAAIEAAEKIWPGTDDELARTLREWFAEWAECEFFESVEVN
jgi:Putative DNA-binding domain